MIRSRQLPTTLLLMATLASPACIDEPDDPLAGVAPEFRDGAAGAEGAAGSSAGSGGNTAGSGGNTAGSGGNTAGSGGGARMDQTDAGAAGNGGDEPDAGAATDAG